MAHFAKRFYGFDPWRWPVISFGTAGFRANLLKNSRPGDRVVFVGTQTEDTIPSERGRLLGVAEFGREAVDTLEVVAREDIKPTHFENGRFRWPKSIPMVRAWRFAPQPLLRSVLQAQLPMNARTMAVRLDEIDTAAVVALPMQELEVRPVEVLHRLRALNDGLTGRGPTTGPRPSAAGQSLVTRTEADEAFTYCFRFGKRDIWKIGRARDWKARLRDVNAHVPHEAIGEQWEAYRFHRWDSENLAHDMEQRLFTILAPFRTQGERIACSAALVDDAWRRAIASDK